MLHFCAYTVLLLLFCTVALLFGYFADQPQVCEIVIVCWLVCKIMHKVMNGFWRYFYRSGT